MRATPLSNRALRSLSKAYKLRRWLRQRRGASGLIDARRAWFYGQVWGEAAAASGGTTRRLHGSLLEVRCGNLRILTDASTTSLDDPVTLRIAGDKPLVYRLLAGAGVPVPAHTVCRADDVAGAWRFIRDEGREGVVKPARRTAGGLAVTTGVASRLLLVRAMALAGAECDEVIVEEMCVGEDYRLLYLDAELLDVVRRSPPTVLGDGRSSIRELIAAENADRLRRGNAVAQSLIGIDLELESTLRRIGYRTSSVPGAGVRVRLKQVVSENRWEDNAGAADAVCPAVVEAGARAVTAVGARLAGVDIIATDLTAPLDESGGAVIEVNTTPSLYYHYMKAGGPTPVASLILRRLAGQGP